MSFLTSFQFYLFWALALGALALHVYALADALRQRTDAFPSTGNQTKPIWLGILGVAVAVGVLSLPNFLSPVNLFSIIALIASGVYLAKVRPAIREITRGGGSSGGW